MHKDKEEKRRKIILKIIIAMVVFLIGYSVGLGIIHYIETELEPKKIDLKSGTYI